MSAMNQEFTGQLVHIPSRMFVEIQTFRELIQRLRKLIRTKIVQNIRKLNVVWIDWIASIT